MNNKLYIQTSQFSQANFSMQLSQQQIQTFLSQLKNMKLHSAILPDRLHHELYALAQDGEKIQNTLYRLDTYVKESRLLYEQLEEKLQRQAQQMGSYSTGLAATSTFATSILFPTSQGNADKVTSSSQYGKWRYDFFDHYMIATHNFNLARGLHSLLFSGVRGELETGAQLVNCSRTDKFLGLYNQAQFSVGTIAFCAQAKGALFDKQRFDPELAFKVNASAATARGLISSRWRNEYIEAKVSAQADIAVAGVKAEAVINKEEITIKGEVGAALAHGEVKGVLNLFGVRITASAQGEVGGIGVAGNFSTTSHSFEIGGKLSCLLGGGANIKFEW